MYRVIIADDEHLIRSSLTKRVDEHEQLTAIASFSNGRKCLDWLENNYADICITDVRMPLVDGISLAKELNELYPWMVTIVISSYDEFTYVQQCLRLGTIDYILKPVDQDVLTEVLDRAIVKMNEIRNEKASLIFIAKFPLYKPLLDEWVLKVQTMQHTEMMMLIVDTVKTFEKWDQEAWYLLDSFARLWMDLVWLELSGLGIQVTPYKLTVTEPELKWVAESIRHQVPKLIAIGMLENHTIAMLKSVQGKDKGHSFVIEQVKRYLEEHYSEKINLQEVADHVSTSRTYLSYLFKQETGMTIWSYLVQIRMEKAKTLLLNTPYKCYEVAQNVGYDDSIHFSKLFKGYSGLNPMEYKKRIRGLGTE